MPEQKENELMGNEPGNSETLVHFGQSVKAMGDGRVGGYLVRFTNPEQPDLEGDYFDANTDYMFEFPGKSTAWFNHALDRKKKKLNNKADLKVDEFGVWAETILDERDQYEKFLLELATEGKLGWSSGTASHLVEREKKGDVYRISRWPLGLDASLTHMPAEPRNSVIPLKTLGELLPPFPDEPKDEPKPEQTGERDGETVEEGETKHLENLSEEVQTMADNEKEVKEEKTLALTEEQLNSIISDAASKAAAKALADLPPIEPKANVKKVEVKKAAEDQPFENAGLFFKAVANAERGDFDVRLKSLQSEDGFAVRAYKAQPTGLGEDEPTEGGYLVGSDTQPGLVERMYQDGEVLNRVSWVDVGPNSNGIVINGIDETSRADGSRWGGVRGYWLAEAATITASQPAFRQMNLRLKKVAALCYATEELLADASALESWILRTVPQELRFKVEDSFINGNTVGKPQGILHDSNIYVSISAETGQAATTLEYENVLKMWARMWAPSRRNAVWFINQDVEPQLNTMTLAVGTAGVPVYLPAGGASGQPYGTLFGRPVIPIEYCQTLGTLGDIILADMSQYQAIRKGGVRSASSMHVQFLTDQMVYRFIYRVDGQPIWHSALTPYKGSNTQSPFMVVATRT